MITVRLNLNDLIRRLQWAVYNFRMLSLHSIRRAIEIVSAYLRSNLLNEIVSILFNNSLTLECDQSQSYTDGG